MVTGSTISDKEQRARHKNLRRIPAVLIVFLLLVSVIAAFFFAVQYLQPLCGTHGQPTLTHRAGIPAAVRYLESHRNAALGLLFESETGARAVEGTSYNLTSWYWLYSDNLLGSLALKPYDSAMSAAINQSVQAYHLQPSRFFEVVSGHPIPADIKEPSNLIIKKTTGNVVMAEVHNSTASMSWQNYGNTLIYQALNEYLAGDSSSAQQYFCEAYRMFDGAGVLDFAVPAEGYATYKLALILYASRVLDLTIPQTAQIESKLWSMQATNGGIITLSDFLARPGNSSNTETTSLALLPYDDQLISRMHSLFGCALRGTCG